MPPERGRRRRNPRGIVDVTPSRPVELPHGRWSTHPKTIRTLYHELFPTEGWIPAPTRIKRPTPPGDLLTDLIRGGHVVVFPSMTGGRQVLKIILTARGKNTRVLNRYFLDPRPFNSYHKERREAIILSLVRDLVYAFDYDPATHSMQHDRRLLNRRHLINQLRRDSSIEDIDAPIITRFGSDSRNWPKSAKNYYKFMVKKAHLSRIVEEWLSFNENWLSILQKRGDMTLYDGL